MNAIRQTQALNKRELENATAPSASWHTDYRDTAWLYVGGLPPPPNDLSEGDILVIFSQFGNPTHLNLIRDRETGKPKGFGFLRYEDQKSCDLAVDNLGGAEIFGRTLRVDHTRYKIRDDEDLDMFNAVMQEEAQRKGEGRSGKRGSDEESSGDERIKRRMIDDGGRRMKRSAIKEDRETGRGSRRKERREIRPLDSDAETKYHRRRGSQTPDAERLRHDDYSDRRVSSSRRKEPDNRERSRRAYRRSSSVSSTDSFYAGRSRSRKYLRDKDERT